MAVSRRQFLAGSLGTAAAAGIAGCSSVHSGGAGGKSSSGSTESAGSKANIGKVTGNLTFAFWGGSTGETAGFNYVKQKFEAANPGAKITLKVVPYDGFFAGIARGIQSNTAPDIFRVDYTTIGKYSSKGTLLDLTQYFTDAESSAFLPALWEAVKYNGVPYGVPHQTDTTCVVYNKAAFQHAGITSLNSSHVHASASLVGTDLMPAVSNAALLYTTQVVSVWCGTPYGVPLYLTASQSAGRNAVASASVM